MTTLLVSEVFPPKTGGSGRWFWEIYRRLPREQFLIAAGRDPRQEEFDRGHNVSMLRLPLENPDRSLTNISSLRCYWRAARALRKAVRDYGVRMLHCGRCLPEGLLALALKRCTGIPYACYTHGEDINVSSVPGTDEGMMASRQFRWLTGVILRNADFVIANSRNTRRILLETWRLPAERIHLLHPGVDTHRFVPDAHRPELRARLGWQDRPVLLTVSRLQRRKGHDLMIRALHSVRRVVPDVLYAVVGAGEERATLEALVQREGLEHHVRFHGPLDDAEMVRCYQQCDLFVLPARQLGADVEGFGMVLVEAQACGKAVVAGASGGTAETLCPRQTGLVVPTEEPAPLAAAVAELLSRPERLADMGRAAREWVVARFDWDQLAQQAATLFGAGREEEALRFGDDHRQQRHAHVSEAAV